MERMEKHRLNKIVEKKVMLWQNWMLHRDLIFSTLLGFVIALLLCNT
jgi:hypothetical protein